MAPDHSVTASNLSDLVLKVAALLEQRGQTLGFAESCTGGLLSASLAAEAGVSKIYMGSIVAYANHVKERVLGVPHQLIQSLGAVSQPVAREMAEGARVALKADWAVSITGIAGPGGGSEQKPVGTVCFGLRGPGVDKVEQRLFQGDRQAIQMASVRFALEWLLGELNDEISRT